MSDTNQSSTAAQPDLEIARERTKQAQIVAWIVGIFVFFTIPMLASNPTWPLAIGVTGLATMVTVICHGILHR